MYNVVLTYQKSYNSTLASITTAVYTSSQLSAVLNSPNMLYTIV